MSTISIVAPIFDAGLEARKTLQQVAAEIDAAIGYDAIDPDALQQVHFWDGDGIEAVAFADQGYALANWLHQLIDTDLAALDEDVQPVILADLGKYLPDSAVSVRVAEEDGELFYEYGANGTWCNPENLTDLGWFEDEFVEVYEDGKWNSRKNHEHAREEAQENQFLRDTQPDF